MIPTSWPLPVKKSSTSLTWPICTPRIVTGEPSLSPLAAPGRNTTHVRHW